MFHTFDRAQSWFSRSGRWLLVFGCFVPGIRHFTALAAGSAALDFRTFCAYAYPGVTLWSATFLTIGYFAGAWPRWEHAVVLLRIHVVLAALLLSVLTLAYAFARRGPWLKTKPAEIVVSPRGLHFGDSRGF